MLENAPEDADINFFQTLMSSLHETFTLLQNAEEERAAGNGMEAVNLNDQGVARLEATKKLARRQPAASCSIS